MRRQNAVGRSFAGPSSNGPFLDGAALGMSINLGNSDDRESRALLVQIPESWRLAGVEDRSYESAVETITLPDRNPHDVPAGQYLRLAVEPLLDPWGRVMLGLDFETPDGPRHAELMAQTRDESLQAKTARNENIPSGSGIRLTAKTVLELSRKEKILFVDGGLGDLLDLSGDRRGFWSQGDSDGVHTLFSRSTRSGRREITLAVRNSVAVKLRHNTRLD
jgi:hypothetical protein